MDNDKETIDIAGMAFDELVDRAETVIAKCPMLFQKSGELVNIVKQRNGMVGFHSIHSSYVRYLLSKAVMWMDGEKLIHPPPSIGRCLLEKDDHGPIKHLRMVVPFPPMDIAGRICSDEGYNAETEVYYTGGVNVSVKDSPTKEDAQKAIAELLEVVCDFPFAGEEHQAAWLAALLSPLSRFMHDGNLPLTVMQANGPRIGKTRLAKIIALIVTGDDIPFISHATEEEESKRMLSFLKLGRSIGLVDNVVGEYGNGMLAAILTSRLFEGRTLGHSRMTMVSNDCSWIVTGNNISLAPDISERSLNIRLRCDDERPNLRSGWKHEDIFAYVIENRARLLSAAMTILKAYVVAGRPKQDMPAFGSFEQWNDLVCGALVWAGMKNPTSTREELERDADAGRFVSSSLVEGWLTLQAALGKFDGMKASEAKAALDDDHEGAEELREALFEITKSKLITAQTISRHLREVRDRNFGGKILRIVIHDDKKGNTWAVLPASKEVDIAA